MAEENTPEQEGIQELENASFADMLAAHEEEQAVSRLEVGQKVRGTVVAITGDAVFVSAGSKVDGLVEKSELEQDGVTSVAVGDVLDLYVVHVSPHEVRLSKVVRGAGSLIVLEEAKAASLPVEGKVTAVVKGGFSVDIMRRRAFCPMSQFDVRPVDNPESIPGKIYNFVITRLEQNGRNIILSRRVLLEAEQAESRDAFLAGVNVGDVLEGAVQRLTPFGAFVEVAPGLEGMVHVSELSWSRAVQPDEVLSLGDKVRVKYLGSETDKKGGLRISLSIRQITEDPWASVAERVHAGETFSGKVLRLSPFGAFIEILPGIEGLAHLSELSWEKRVNKAEEVLSVGETVNVKVKEVVPEKRRVSLSVRDAAGNPWDEVPEGFPLDSEHVGRLEKRAQFGLFVNLAPGVTGLMPNSLFNNTKGKNKFLKLAPGDEILVRISEMDLAARKLTLAPAGEDAEEVGGGSVMRSEREAGDGRPARDSRDGRDGKPRGPRRDKREDGEWKKHAQSSSSGNGGFGSLGAALAEAMKNKK
ncbi:MAG: S1 RNA-binding domain-containing protein [Deltaproteobacteria bacterium]|jgi:small subunit ribosomal protein S1|nr:S1 RNA-binding domain-containing protein [Deltaproteobacteria bacterium]